MDGSVISGLMFGFSEVLSSPTNLAMIALGCVLGTWIGMMPGIGPPAGIALLLPFTYGLNPTAALILFSGIYFGAMYGGSISSILINMPGDAGSVMTTLDGHPMARKGRAGAALVISAVASFVGGTISILGLTFLATYLARVAVGFGPAEYSALMVLSLVGTASFIDGTVVKGLIVVSFGLLLGTVGIDLQTGSTRFTFGMAELYDGVSSIAVIVGIYSISEALEGIRRYYNGEVDTFAQVGRLMMSREEWVRSRWAMVRGSFVGFFTGILPGHGATIATFVSYTVEYRISKHKEEFGKGAPEGVAGPEAANNAAASGAMVPLLTLGIPGSGTTAVMLGALLIYGIQPGPKLFEQHPDIAWGVIASLYVANVVLVILNIPLVGFFVRLLKVPPLTLNLGIIVLAISSVYIINLSVLETGISVAFGIIGYAMRRLAYPITPLILGLVLSPLLEQSTRQALTLAGGSWWGVVSHPIVAVLLIASAILLLAAIVGPLISKFGQHTREAIEKAETEAVEKA
ncbi:tripartite tricarboxylate transporter permease [Starkeya sp. ORNL1]|uniref:tripartite tricarboxylate transporter permease n=1 Tax=Starkeya sp. ORNL1 TaxID=2709380 RepID=UPI001FEE1EF6|nr:tripartite tricarboxylate transporter permease [Starkeya sp. ORNL1]